MKKKSTINNDVQLLSLELQKEVMILRQSLTLLKENLLDNVIKCSEYVDSLANKK